tara:strand:+ start:69 stop:299 length:231 start_codon:yes stop_codon:yes gene_type:complete
MLEDHSENWGKIARLGIFPTQLKRSITYSVGLAENKKLSILSHAKQRRRIGGFFRLFALHPADRRFSAFNESNTQL